MPIGSNDEAPLTPTTSRRYRIVGPLGQGGMGEVFFARAHSVGGFSRAVVMKRLRPEIAGDPAVVRMFLDEARLCAALNHPNVVQMLDVGSDGEGCYSVMEYLRGYDLMTVLRRLHRRGERLDLGVALHVVQAACLGLHHAHEARGADGAPLGLVHRDVSPHNVLVTFDGEVKVIDFGIAKAKDRLGGTRTGAIKGKLGYMSPEQCRGRSLDRRSDIFGLGILLVELTTGRRAYAGDDDYEILRAIVEDPQPRPSHALPDYPPQLEAIAMRALAPDPAARYPSALAMHDDLQALAAARGQRAGARELASVLGELFAEEIRRWGQVRGDDAQELLALAVPREPELLALVDTRAARAQVALAPSTSPPRTQTAVRWPRRRRVIAAAALLAATAAAALVPTALARRSSTGQRTTATELAPASVEAVRADSVAPAAVTEPAPIAPPPQPPSSSVHRTRSPARRALPRKTAAPATEAPRDATPRPTSVNAAEVPAAAAEAPTTSPSPKPAARPTTQDCPDDDCVL